MPALATVLQLGYNAADNRKELKTVMPIYTYRCDHCGIQFERQQGFNDRRLMRCPECGKKSVHKVFLPVGILFKGSGFYATDHRSPSGQTTHPDRKKEESKPEKGGTDAGTKKDEKKE